MVLFKTVIHTTSVVIQLLIKPELNQSVPIGNEGHVRPVILRGAILNLPEPFLCDDRVLPVAVARSDSEPSSTLVKQLSLGFPSDCYHRCGPSDLLHFYAFKNDLFWFTVHAIVLETILRNVLLVRPVKAALSFLSALVACIHSEHKLIESDRLCAHVGLCPVVLDQTTQVVLREVEHSHAIEVVLLAR